MTFRAFSIGFSAAVLAFACGGDSGGDEDTNDEPIPTVERETCTDNPLLAGCAEQLPDRDINDEPIDQPDPVDPADPPPQGSPRDLAAAQAGNILASNCGRCHGPALTQEQASAGMNYINDLDRLAETGKLIPGNSAGSRIIQRMRDGSMPPFTSGLPNVSEQEIDVVAQFIDNTQFWDIEDGGGCPDQLFSWDDLYQTVADDLSDLDADDALTARYISLTNRFTAGVCADTTLDNERQGLFKMLNSLSTDPTITKPIPINEDETIYRIDLEDYGWDLEGTLVDADGNATVFNDKWELLLSVNDYAVEFEGDDSDDAKLDSGTTIPVVLADSLLDAATIGNTYYAMIDVDVLDTLDNFILNTLQVDVAQNLLDEDQLRAGTTKSRISRQDRVVQRDELGVRQGAVWQSFDFVDDENQSIFVNVFDFLEGGTESIFTLENGLFGYIIADADSIIKEDSDILLDTAQNNFRAVTMVSCASCHAQGLIPVIDEVRTIALANARTSNLDNDEVEQIEAIYAPPAEFARVVDDDSQIYKSSLSRAGVELQGVEPISNVFFRFDRDITLADAAGDLGVLPEDLEGDLNLLNPEVQVLERGGTMDRDDFTQFYVNSLCILTVTGENAPLQQLCDDVEANGGLVP